MEKLTKAQQEKEAWKVQIVASSIVTIIAGLQLIAHYVFGIEIEGWTRKLGQFDETVVWVFFVIGVPWLVYSWKSYKKLV